MDTTRRARRFPEELLQAIAPFLTARD